jgi:hypothetical protein
LTWKSPPSCTWTRRRIFASTQYRRRSVVSRLPSRFTSKHARTQTRKHSEARARTSPCFEHAEARHRCSCMPQRRCHTSGPLWDLACVGACAYLRSGETGSFRSRTHLRLSPCAPTPRQRMSHGVCARWMPHKSCCRLHGAGCARSVARPMCVACGLVRMHASIPMLDVAHVGNCTLHGVRFLLHVACCMLHVACCI